MCCDRPDSVVADVPEQQYFTGMDEPGIATQQQPLLQCFPNPCDDFTNLAFAVKQHSRVRLEVLDISGHHVAVLIDQDLPKGNYETKLNTALLSSGVYLCRITIGTFSDQLKIVVTR